MVLGLVYSIRYIVFTSVLRLEVPVLLFHLPATISQARALVRPWSLPQAEVESMVHH